MTEFFQLLTWTSQGKSVGITAKEHLKTSKIAKFKSDTFQETEEIALQRFENLPELMVGDKFVPPTPQQTSVKFGHFEEPYLR